MPSLYQYSLSTDFSNTLNKSLLISNINNEGSLPGLITVTVSGDNVSIIFTLALSETQQIALDNIVNNFNPNDQVPEVTDTACVQVRRTSTVGPFGSYTDVTFDSTDYENLPIEVKHNVVNTERININTKGTYLINYSGVVTADRVDARVQFDGTTTLNGSQTYTNVSGSNDIISATAVRAFSAGQYLTLQIQSTGSGIVVSGLTFSVVRLRGVQGLQGPIGATGPVGAGSGDVLGAVSSVDNTIPRFDGTSGTQLQNSGVTIDDNDNLYVGGMVSTDTLDVEYKTPDTADHISFRVANDFVTDTFNFGIGSITNRSIAAARNGINQQAALLLSKSDTASGPIFGVSSSTDTGSTWNPRFIITQEGNIGIGTNTPSSVLDIVGDLSVSGTVDGVDIAAHNAATSAHGVTGNIVGTTDTQTLTNKTMVAVSNNIAAKSLHNMTGVVDISASAAPSVGQTLKATSATTATWQDVSGITKTGSSSDLEIAVFDGVGGNVVKGAGVRHYGTSSTDPTTPTPQAGDLYYNSDINYLMKYDAYRTKWLSVATLCEGCGVTGTTIGGTFYNKYDGMTMSATRGSYIAKGTIVRVGYTNKQALTHTFQVLVNGVIIVSVPSGGAVSISNDTLNEDFEEGIMSMKNAPGSGKTSAFQAVVYYKLRV